MPVGRHPLPRTVWFKSSYSGGNTTECLEAAVVEAGVLIRDSKKARGARIAVSSEAWATFLARSVK
ncbi:DUF397 domain-containing protein [Streptomyces mangrovisoli]|uniref:DUF397 domain-containing protein n=1 Tax=Streptomyces mangrovisoli TaxID=1428628 RepID=A0A1J4NVG9_9ACTN|nr:DUF397 domain-containing protein [Streptomyces mangrovisoli]OIJ65221.1 hypothetical protein WN71_024655 [Streptomyces mangrovisoli]